MLKYEEELKKFKPCLDVTDVESAIYNRNLTDIIDILNDLQKNRADLGGAGIHKGDTE